jgi:membrane associated rhomboid family serine protease
VFLFFYISVIPIPALLWVAAWFFLQIIQGFAARGGDSGVAWFAHIGGLIAGVVLLAILRPRRRHKGIAPFSTSWQQ